MLIRMEAFDALWAAVGCGHVDTVKHFLSSEETHVDINQYSGSDTLLHFAAQQGNVACCSILLDSGADIAAKTKDLQQSPLHIACEKNHAAVAQFLLEKGADINQMMLHKTTALRVAARSGAIDAVRVLLNYGNCDLDAADRTHRTPLQSAIEQGHIEVVKLLIAAGCNVTTQDYLGRTSMFHAVRLRRCDMIQVLADAGCPLSLPDRKGYSAMHLAAHMGYLDVVQLLLKLGCDPDLTIYNSYEVKIQETPLGEAIRWGRLRVVRELLAAGASTEPIGMEDEHASTLLIFFMTNRCNMAILQELITYGANVNIASYGFTILRLAVEKEWYAAAELILLADCDVAKEIPLLREKVAENDIAQINDLLTLALSIERIPQLKLLCRRVVRHELRDRVGRGWVTAVDNLPLPNLIKDYLCYRYHTCLPTATSNQPPDIYYSQHSYGAL